MPSCTICKKPVTSGHVIDTECLKDLTSRLAAYNKAKDQERLVILPCKPGDTIYFVDKTDCHECKKADSCAGFSSGGRGLSHPEPVDISLCPFGVVECEVDRVAYVYDNGGMYFVVNECYEFTDPIEIRLSRAEAETDLTLILSMENQKCRVCGCTWNNACEGGCYWVEDDLCSKCVGK